MARRMTGADEAGIDEARELVASLVAIESVNPDLVPGGSGESQVVAFAAEWLRERGLEVSIDVVAPGRPNLVAIARGRGGGRRLLLNGHLDTVAIDEMPEALTPTVADGRLYARGASDMKGGVAALMLAAADAAAHDLAGDVVFAGVIDEEYGSLGTEALVRRHTADAAIVAEPSGLRLGVAHKGFVWLEVTTEGVAAHGSRPDAGVDAISKMGRVLTAVDDLAEQLAQSEGHSLLGTGSVHCSLIKGGHEVSTYPSACTLTLERRTIPGEWELTVRQEIESIVREIELVDDAFRATVSTFFARPALDGRADAPIAQAIARHYFRITGSPIEVAGMTFWTDAAILAEAGIPAVVFGPIGVGDHSASEWVDLASVETCRRVITAVAEEFCG